MGCVPYSPCVCMCVCTTVKELKSDDLKFTVTNINNLNISSVQIVSTRCMSYFHCCVFVSFIFIHSVLLVGFLFFVLFMFIRVSFYLCYFNDSC